jgi:hypothetical protein
MDTILLPHHWEFSTTNEQHHIEEEEEDLLAAWNAAPGRTLGASVMDY